MIKCIAIDDDPLFLQLIGSYFDDYEDMELISTYENPAKGIHQVVKQKPDVLLIDLEMPYLDGFETLDTLDKKPKIIMISAHVNMPTKDKKLKIDKYLRKVVLDKEMLRNAILQVTA
ncbi:MAG: response regulator [Ekhidna sp.]|uniref:LytR/AlgR family response regulator transcription factor n=1 Tax=Ekhidna sp. TaxID=2608089 RepID=UPI0032ED7327